MATGAKNYLDLTGLQAYDTLIKTYIGTGDAKAIKTVLWDETNEQIKFYKKENATLSDTADYSVTISSSDVANLKTRVGMTSTLNSYESQTNLTDIMNVLTGSSSTTGSVAKAAADAVSTAEGYTDTELGKLNADLDASGTATHSGTFVVSGVTQTDGKLTAVDSVEVEAAGAAAAAVAALNVNEFALTSSDSDGRITIKGIKEVNGKIAIGDGSGVELGTAAIVDKATSAITEKSSDNSLVSAAQVSAFVAAEIAGLEGAMHFRGVITRQTGETDAEAIARVITSPVAGDVVVMSDNAKEYIYESSTIGWKEVGDETEFVKKTTTIAGVDLEDNITKSELQTALGLGSAAYEAATAFDAAGTAQGLINALDATESQAAGTDGLALSITQADGLITSISGSIAANTYDAYGTASKAVAALDGSATIASYTAGTSGAADVITIKAGVVEADGVVSNDSGDDITLSNITTAQINALFGKS